MFTIQLSWKEHNIDMAAVESFLRQTYPAYLGNSADDSLRLHFSEPLTSYEEAAVRSYWDGLTEESAEAQSYVSAEEIKAAIDAVRASALNKLWDLMTPAEKKVCLGLTPTREELGL